MISTHILDLSSGQPAAAVEVELEVKSSSGWTTLKKDVTNKDGRISFDVAAQEGIYRLNFITEDYLRKNKRDVFFLSTPVTFQINDTSRKYHIPLLLNTYGYSTYRGS